MKTRPQMILHWVAALLTLLLSASTGLSLTVQWAPMASQSNYLLEEANPHNPGGIDHSWNDMSLLDLGQRGLAGFRSEMSAFGRYGGGINWDNLQAGTEIANAAGVSLDIDGLPFNTHINSVTNGNAMTVSQKEQPQPEPKNAGPVSGDKYVVEFDNINPSNLTLDFQTDEGYELHGFGIVFANSGWSLGGASITFYNEQTQLARFGTGDGVLFLDHSFDDNFIGYWTDEAITRVQIKADDMVAMGRFDDIGLIFTPEPTTLLLLGLGAAMIRRRK